MSSSTTSAWLCRCLGRTLGSWRSLRTGGEELAAVAQAALEDGADWLVTPGRRSTDGRLVANLIRNCHKATPRPDLQRMRSTWIVRHLTAGTLPAALVPAAGVDGLFSLARYLVHVPAVDPAESRRLLRLAEEVERT